MTMAGRMQVPDPALSALKAQVRASITKVVEPPAAAVASAAPSSDSRSVYVSCESGATQDQCRQFLQSCGRILRIESTIPDKSVFRVEFESESSVDTAMQLQSSDFVIVKCQSGASRLSPVPDGPSTELNGHQNEQPKQQASESADVADDDDDKEEGEVSDTEDGSVPIAAPVPSPSSAFPPRRHSFNFSPRDNFDFRPEPVDADLRREPDLRRMNDFGRPMEPQVPVHGGFFLPVTSPPPLPPPAPHVPGHYPVFNRYTVAPPYLGRIHRAPLPSESPIFFHRYSPIMLPVPLPPRPLPSIPPNFADKTHGLPSPPFRPPVLKIDTVSDPLVSNQLPSPHAQQPDENFIAELKRKALLSKGARSASDAKLEDGAAPKKKSKSSKGSSANRTAANTQASTDAVQFLKDIVDSDPMSSPPLPTPPSQDAPTAEARPGQSSSNNNLADSSGATTPNQSLPAVVKTETKKPAQPIRKRRQRSVARHPDDPFIIHLDGNTSDDSDDSESIGDVGDDSKLKRAPNAGELLRIKANMEKLRQRIAAAEAASTNGNGTIVPESISTPKVQPDARKKQVQAPLSQADTNKNPSQPSQPAPPAFLPVPAQSRAPSKPSKPQPSTAARQSALQTRLATIAELRSKVSSLEQRRAMLQTRLQITEQNVIRLKQMIERHDEEISTAAVELSRQQSEFDMLTKTLNSSTSQQDGSQPAVRSPTHSSGQLFNTKFQVYSKEEVPASHNLAAEHHGGINSVVDAVRSQISELRPRQRVVDSHPSNGSDIGGSSFMQDFHYESPITVSRGGSSDPNAMVCQFALFGHCNDDGCKMLHLTNPESRTSSNPTTAKAAELHPPPSASDNSSVTSLPFSGVANLPKDSLQNPAASEEAEADDFGYISLDDQQRTDQECMGSVISVLAHAVNSSAGTDRYFSSTDLVSQSELESDPMRPGLWLQYCLQLARSDGAAISDILDTLARAIAHNPKDVDLYTVQLEIARLSPDVTDDQLLSLARAACEANPESEALRSVLAQISP